jgi:hypothetical protein
MSSTPEGRLLTEAHRVQQARLGADTVRQMHTLFRVLDPANLDRTVERWLSLAVPLVQAQRTKSSAAAGRYVAAFRTAETGAAIAPVLADTAPAAALLTSLTVTGPVALKRAAARGVELDQAVDLATVQVGKAAMRHALNGGRDTITQTVSSDPRALGWARAVSGKPCAFCAMLASRGPVYAKDTAGFDAHDGCSCSAEPVYSAAASWPPGGQQYRQLWDETTAGLGGQDAVNAFRVAVSGT